MFGLVSYLFRRNSASLGEMDPLMYYWFCFTTLTGFWESVYLTNYNEVAQYAAVLVETKKSVWTSLFPIGYVCPYHFSKIFYAEYGANADREYMSQRKGDYWSRLIESSHAVFCALFTSAALVNMWYTGNQYTTTLIGLMGMSSQFMNSLLYMGEYFLQCRDNSSPNFSCPNFPLGRWMYRRLFMWINLFWLLFPALISVHALHVDPAQARQYA